MKANKSFIYILLIFFVISINSIYSFSSFLSDNSYELIIRQALFYLIGVILIVFCIRTSVSKLLKYSFYIYLFNIILLILVLFVGTEVNGARAWFSIPLIGTFQPSEFMKIGLILFISKIISEHKINCFKDEIFLVVKVFVVLLIPSFFTFLEPDTGAVFIYFVIVFVMLFTSKIRIRWFFVLFLIIGFVGCLLLYIYVFKTDLFISIFGSSMFYRFDRIFDWSKASGMQLENSIISIGSSGYFGHGISNILLYFPEGHTDFIFASYASIYGFVGMLILIICLVWFDVLLIKTKTRNIGYKYVISGICGALFYQQIQNISMTIGLMPITGITLPFISYGGSSLISYMILLGFVFSIRYEEFNRN